MSRRLSVVSLSLFVFACGRVEEMDDAEDADESAAVTTAESALTTELSDEVTQPVSLSAADLAKAASVRVGSRLQPAGCLVTTVNGATVTYTMADCTGPYGLVHVSGVLTAVYSRASMGEVSVVITGSGIKANQATFDVNSTVKASQAAGVRRAEVVCDSSGTGARGGGITRQGTYTVTYEPTTQCVTLNGTWQTRVGLRTASTVVSGYARCKGACPATGGSIAHTTVRSATVTVTYDGTSTASWATSGGRSGTVALRCGG